MGAIAGATAGFTGELFRTNKFNSITASTAATGSASGNQVIDVSEMGAVTKERATITYPIYGKDTEGSISGQVAAISFEFTVTLSMDNAGHVALRDDSGKTLHGWVMRFTKGGNITYCVFNGTIGNATVTPPIDGVINMSCSVNLDGGVTWVNNA